MQLVKKFFVVILLGIGGNAWAAAPDLLPPLSMQVGAGINISALSLDFVEHPKSGPINFSPTNYDIHLPGNVTLPVQDVVPFFGVRTPITDCKAVSQILYDYTKSLFEFLVNTLTKVSGIPITPLEDPTKVYDGLFKICNAMDANQKEALFADSSFSRQNVADVRNIDSKSTNVIFSGEALAPYSGGFPMAVGGYAGVVVGDIANGSKDLWNDAVILAGYTPVLDSKTLGTPAFNSSLSLYRFLPNPAGSQALQLVGYSSAWLDKPAKDNAACFDATDPKKPVPLPLATLVKNGCVGEHHPTGIVALNFYNHANSKMKDLVVVSRAPMGDAAGKTGYITLYKRNEALPAPADTSRFYDIWQFDRSYTNATYGISESYGIAKVKNWDPIKNTEYEGVVVGSNKLQGSRYYVYYFVNGMTEPKAIMVGGTVQGLPGDGGFGPYRVYSSDVNNDRCGDILITRARISPDAKKIEFADYFDVHLQHKLANGECKRTFEPEGNKYQIPAVDPKNPPQITSLAVGADFNKDGHDDVMAADFTIHLNKTTGIRENFVHFLEYKNGIFNTIQPPRFVVTTKNHGDDVGPIDIKADAYANLGVVIGKPIALASVAQEVPNPCAIDPQLGTVDPNKIDPATCSICSDKGDTDGDGFNELPYNDIPVMVKTCINGKMQDVFMELNTTPFTYTPDCSAPQISATKTGKQWIHEWAGCDNCSATSQVVCKGKENADPCWNQSQSDKDSDGYGDSCFPKPASNCGVGGQKYEDSWLDPALNNDKDQDGIPDCQVYTSGGKQTTSFCKAICDNCSEYFPDQATMDACKVDPSQCANPDQKTCMPKPQQAPAEPAAPQPSFNGHDVTVLLNKTIVKDTKKQCTNGDLACICEQNPDLLVCKCLKDPQAPECKTDPTAQPICAVDVCRGDLKAPFPRMCDYIRPFNDEIRRCTGLNLDPLIPVEGVQYHVSCTMPNTPALDLGNGLAYTRVYKTGQLPKNYFNNRLKPVADDNVLARPVLLNPPSKAADGTDLDISPLPNPTFDADPLLSVVPNATLIQAPGIIRIDGIMEIQTNLVDMAGVAGAGKAVPGGAAAKVLSLDIKGFSSPAGCQWDGPDCPRPMPRSPSAGEYVKVICAKAKETEDAGKAVTVDTVNDAFNSMNVGPAFLHQKLVIPGAQGAVIIPMQNTVGNMSAEGGCGCSITAASTLHNTALPLLMALSALGGMVFFRRNTAKKR